MSCAAHFVTAASLSEMVTGEKTEPLYSPLASPILFIRENDAKVSSNTRHASTSSVGTHKMAEQKQNILNALRTLPNKIEENQARVKVL